VQPRQSIGHARGDLPGADFAVLGFAFCKGSAAKLSLMLRRVPPLFLLLAACGSAPSQAGGSSVTVTLPPPKDVATPGFSSSLRDPAGSTGNSAAG
jgi:hypothetical protein